jgi:hypothetical protein
MRLVKDPAAIPSGTLSHVHRGHQHFWQRALSRRQFIGGTAAVTGAVAGSGLLSPILARADEGHIAPKPLTYGFQPAPGTPTFRFSLLQPDSELSSITDFKGRVGAADVQGMGTATHPDGTKERLLFDSDMRFMQGVYVGVDGKVHQGSFAFV